MYSWVKWKKVHGHSLRSYTKIREWSLFKHKEINFPSVLYTMSGIKGYRLVRTMDMAYRTKGKFISLCLISDHSLITYLHIFVCKHAECLHTPSSISPNCTNIIPSIDLSCKKYPDLPDSNSFFSRLNTKMLYYMNVASYKFSLLRT